MCRNGPEGASHKLGLSPFFQRTQKKRYTPKTHSRVYFLLFVGP